MLPPKTRPARFMSGPQANCLFGNARGSCEQELTSALSVIAGSLLQSTHRKLSQGDFYCFPNDLVVYSDSLDISCFACIHSLSHRSSITNQPPSSLLMKLSGDLETFCPRIIPYNATTREREWRLGHVESDTCSASTRQLYVRARRVLLEGPGRGR